MSIKFNHQKLHWFIFLSLFCAYAGFTFAGAAHEEIKTITVTGMVCGACELKVEATLKDINGITYVEASHKRRTVLVKYNSNVIAIEAMVKAIKDLGYGARI